MKKLLLLLALTFLPASFASAEQADDEYYEFDDEPTVNDPFESVNRAIYGFNNVIDEYALDPIARGYNYAIPKWGRDRVSNFTYNISEPVNLLNSALQGNDTNAFTSLWRFIINSTFGLAGTFDAASEIGLKKQQEDFAQTLHVWGLDDSPYIVLPILGPSTVTHLTGLGVDYATNPFNYEAVLDSDVITAHTVATIVDQKAKAVVVTDNINKTALDPYTTLRSVYLQNFEQRAETR